MAISLDRGAQGWGRARSTSAGASFSGASFAGVGEDTTMSSGATPERPSDIATCLTELLLVTRQGRGAVLAVEDSPASKSLPLVAVRQVWSYEAP